MKLPALFRDTVHRLLAARGYALVNLYADRARMARALRSIGCRHPDIATVIDVGASDGRWSADLMPHLPRARYLLIEAQSLHKPALDRFCAKHPNAQVALAAGGGSVGQIYFEADVPFGGRASLTPPAQNCITVPVTTIDHEVQTRKLPGPYLIKLDTHGFELPILEGAKATLAQTDVVVMECYNFHVMPEALLFDEMCRHMHGLGFRTFDLVDPLHRPHDDALWQVDIVFMRETHPAFNFLGFH